MDVVKPLDKLVFTPDHVYFLCNLLVNHALKLIHEERRETFASKVVVQEVLGFDFHVSDYLTVLSEGNPIIEYFSLHSDASDLLGLT